MGQQAQGCGCVIQAGMLECCKDGWGKEGGWWDDDDDDDEMISYNNGEDDGDERVECNGVI